MPSTLLTRELSEKLKVLSSPDRVVIPMLSTSTVTESPAGTTSLPLYVNAPMLSGSHNPQSVSGRAVP